VNSNTCDISFIDCKSSSIHSLNLPKIASISAFTNQTAKALFIGSFTTILGTLIAQIFGFSGPTFISTQEEFGSFQFFSGFILSIPGMFIYILCVNHSR